MFEIVVALALFVAGVVAEYHFAIYEKVAIFSQLIGALLVALLRRLWYWFLAQRWLLWFGRLAVFGGALGLALLLVIFIINLAPPVPSVAPKSAESWSLWGLLTTALGVLLALLIAGFTAIFNGLWSLLINGLGTLLTTLTKLFFAMLVGLATLLPSCRDEPAPTVTKKWERIPLTPGVLATSVHPPLTINVEVKKGEGCIRVTRRGGFPLSLAECLELTHAHGLRSMRNARGFIEAPRLYVRDELMWRKGEGWSLLR